MASNIVKRGKLYLDIFYPEQIQKSFEAHRDLKSCMSLRQALIIFKENEEFLRSHEKTAFLQFLNNYPMSYSFRSSKGPMSLFYQSRSLKNLSMYEQQLKFSVLTRLREYMPKYTKENIGEFIEQQEVVLLERIKTQPFDIVHASNFLFLQKETTNNLLFEHCLWSLKNSDYSILLSVFPRITPMLLKRLGVNEWNILRQFKHLLDFIVYDWHTRGLTMAIKINNLMNMVELQLHLIGYQRIPIFIDEVIAQISQNLQNQNMLDTTSIQMVFSAFRYLPLTYNEKAFNIIRTSLISRFKLKNENFYGDRMPYHRMTTQQIDQLYQAGLNKQNILDSLIYIGHNHHVRKWICNSRLLESLYERHCSVHQATIKNFATLSVTASLLVEAYEGDQRRCEAVVKVWRQTFLGVHKINSTNKIALMLPLASILNVIELNDKFKLGLPVNELFQEFVKRTGEYQLLTYLSNVLLAVELYYNSQNPQIIKCISTILSKIVEKNSKFNFRYFTDFVLLLERSASHHHYADIIQAIYQRLQPDDLPYFVELYNRFPNKSIRMNNNIIDMIWKKQHSFKSIGKLLFTSNYSLFTSPKGYLAFELKNILNQLQPLLTVQDLQIFKLAQITYILNFCRNFYPSIKTFSRKLLLVALKYADQIDLKKQGLKLSNNFMGAVAAMAVEYELYEEFADKVIKLLTVLKTNFPQQMMLALKQIQIEWLFKLGQNSNKTSLVVAEVVDTLSQVGYEPQYFDAMITLLKLHALEVFSLSPHNLAKLQGIIISAIEQKNSRLTLLTTNASLFVKKNIADLNPERSRPLVRVMTKCLQESNASHSFEYLWTFVELGYRAKDQNLLTLALNNMGKIQLYPYQIVKLFQIIKYFPNLSLAQFAANIISHIHAFSHALEPFLAEILFTLHSNQNNIPFSKSSIFHDLFDKNQYILVKAINTSDNKVRPNRESDENRLLLRVLKSLWISIKTNTFSPKSLELYKYVLANEEKMEILRKNKNLEGLTWEYLYYIYPVFSKKFEKELEVPSKPATKKPFKKEKEAAYRRDLFKTEPTLDFMTKQQREAVEAHLANMSLTEISSQKLLTSSDNCYIVNRTIKGITFPYWLRKDQKEFGLIFLDPRYFNQKLEQKGRVSFMINALKILTTIPIKAVVPGEKIELTPQ